MKLPPNIIPQTMEDHVANMAARLRNQERAIARQRERIGTLSAENVRLKNELEDARAELRATEAKLFAERHKRHEPVDTWPYGGPPPVTYRERIGR